LIKLLATEMRKTVLISSHILTELGEICDSAAIIEAGKILASGTIHEIQQERKKHAAETQEATILAARVLNDIDRLERFLLEQPYVGDVAIGPQQVSFTFAGDGPAQAQLLRKLIEEGFEVVDFTGKTQTLEDAFMAITKGITQ
jgi:ABC-2 type transport system ATP-binding protein